MSSGEVKQSQQKKEIKIKHSEKFLKFMGFMDKVKQMKDKNNVK